MQRVRKLQRKGSDLWVCGYKSLPSPQWLYIPNDTVKERRDYRMIRRRFNEYTYKTI
jgi:hypothetical protein